MFLKLFENVIGSFELSGLVQFVASCCRLLHVVVCSCKLFRLFRLVQAVSSWFRLFEKVLGCLGRPGCSACSKLFSDSVRLPMFSKLSLVGHVVELNVVSLDRLVLFNSCFWLFSNVCHVQKV